jgi:glycerol dehydrogenase
MKFAHRVGLSINLNELGFSDIDENEVILIAKKATLPGETIHNKPYRVTPERVVDAMKTANTIGIEVAKQHPIRKIQK